MRKIFLLGLALASSAALVAAKSPPTAVDFSGAWVLDTSQTKNLPQGLDSYSMNIKQSEQRLAVQTTLKGDLRPMASVPNGPNGRNGPNAGGNQGPGTTGPYPGTTPGGYPGGMGGGMGVPRIGGMGMPGGMGRGPMGEGMPGGGMPGGGGGIGRHRHGRKPQGATAFMLYPSRAVYNLDGSESAAKMGGDGQNNATLRANWEKGGKELRLALTGDDNSDRRGRQLQLKDDWKMSKDGQTLKVDRTVKTPGGSKTLHLVFHKQDSTAATNPAS